MKLDQLIHWRLEGKPDVFTEMRDGEEWRVIHSGGATHDAGFFQTVYFDKPIKVVSLSAVATLYTTGGGLMLRLGMVSNVSSHPGSNSIQWSGWYGPDNGWPGTTAQILRYIVHSLNTNAITVFLQSTCRYPARANTSRWRDVQLEVEYADQEPELQPEPDPPPEPDPDPVPDPDLPDDDPRKWAIERMREIQIETVGLVEQSVILLDEVGELAAVLGLTEEERARALKWIAEYNDA